MSLLGCHSVGLDQGYREDRFGLLWLLVDPHFFGLTPAGGSVPKFWMGLTDCLLDIGPLLADCGGGSAVTLMGHDEFDAAMPMPLVVLIHKRRHPLACLVFAGEWPAGVVGPVLDRSEQ